MSLQVVGHSWKRFTRPCCPSEPNDSAQAILISIDGSEDVSDAALNLSSLVKLAVWNESMVLQMVNKICQGVLVDIQLLVPIEAWAAIEMFLSVPELPNLK